MGRPERLNHIAYSNAERSDLNIKHGAVLSKGSKPIYQGVLTLCDRECKWYILL